MENNNLQKDSENDTDGQNCSKNLYCFVFFQSSKKSPINPDIHFISDEESRITLTVQNDKIAELKNVESYLDEELSEAEKAIKALFIQFTALQRHTLRRHLKISKTMVKDLDDLLEFLNDETFPSCTNIKEELKLWKDELEKTYEQILNLKKYFLYALNRAEVLDYSVIIKMPLFITGLRNTRSILHGNFELAYKYLSDVYKIQKLTITSLKDVIQQHKVTSRLISKLSEVLPVTRQLIFNPAIHHSYQVIPPLNNFANRSNNLNAIPEEHSSSQSDNEEL